MSLSCSFDAEVPDVYREKMVVARKPHRCCECPKAIEIGELYEYLFLVFDGTALSEHTCEKCSDLRQSLVAAGFCGYIGELHADHQEYLLEYDPPKLGFAA